MTFQEIKDTALLRGWTVNQYGGYVETHKPGGSLISSGLSTNGLTADQIPKAIFNAPDQSAGGNVLDLRADAKLGASSIF